MEPVCFQIDARDNVATLLADGDAGATARRMGGGAAGTVALSEAVARGHKVALADLGPGDPVIKYGLPIGRATRPIRRGDWVHLHNCASALDERSSSLDPTTGAPRDVPYA